MKAVDLVALAKGIEADLAAAQHHREQALEFIDRPDVPGAATVVAASLHHYYSAVEALTERALRAFGHTIPSGPRWHAELLELAGLEIEGTRPALFRSVALGALVELQSFRHFFRHAYAVAWDHARLRRNCEVMASAQADIDGDLSRFVAILRATALAEG